MLFFAVFLNFHNSQPRLRLVS